MRYVNQKKVPHLFVATGAAKWGDYKEYPWTTGFQPDYRTEAQIYAKYILKQKPNAKVAVLYQNDDFGKDYLVGLKAVLGDRYAKMATEATYEPTDPTVDSQIATLQAVGCRRAGGGGGAEIRARRRSARSMTSAGSRCSS